MELLFELILTAAATLFVAVLLAKLFASAANADPRHDRAAVGPADVIVEEEEERIIEVDEVKERGAAAQTLSEGWVEVEKPAAEGKAAWVAVEEEVPATLAPELFLGTVLEERKEEGEVGKKPRDLTAATEAAAKGSGEDAVPREILGLELEKGTVQQHDLAAQVAPIEFLDAELQKQQVQSTEALVVEHRHHAVAESAAPAQVMDAGLEEEEEEAQADEVIHPRELASETVPDEVLDVVPEKQQEERVIEVGQHELAAEVAPREITDEVARKLAPEVAPREITNEVARELAPEVAPREITDEVARELAPEVAPIEITDEVARELAPEVAPIEITDEMARELAPEVAHIEITDEVARELAPEVAPIEITDEVARELAPEAAPRAIPDVVATVEESKEQSVEEVADQHEEVQNREEAQCELGPVDQLEKPVPEEELAATKAGDLNVSQEGSSNDKVAVQFPEKEATLLGMPEDEAKANMEFEEWEGIERSEVEKRFGAAAAFAASDAGAAALSKLDSDVQLQLQGLLKVAIDGPCYDSTQPLTLRPSSRAKWVSWQKLGNMHPEIAMEKYMDLLSEYIPTWIGDKASSTKKHGGDVDSEGVALTMTAHTSDPQTNQGNEGSTSIDEGPLTSLPDPEKGQSSDIPAE